MDSVTARVAFDAADGRHAHYLSQRRFANLDGLRAFSILAVIWHHTHGAQSLKLFGRGFLGVDMFFVLSGFLIVSRLLREEAATGTISLRAFYQRRVRRIFPVYYVILVGCLLWLIVAPNSTSGVDFKHGLFWAATYLSNWVEAPGLLAVTWSLACEEQFYLVWPLIQRFLHRQAVWALAALTLVNVALQLGAFNRVLSGGRFDPKNLNVLQVTFTPILFGVALAYVLHSERGFRLLDRWVAQPYVAAVAGGACFVVAALPISSVQGLPRLTIHCLMTITLAAVILRETGRSSAMLQLKPLAYIGTLSYGMYLMHMFVRLVVEKLFNKIGLHAGVLLFVTVTIVTTIVAAVSFEGLESRFLRRSRSSRPLLRPSA